MAKSVRLSRRSKRKLDSLHTEVKKRTGRKISQQQLLDLILDDAMLRKTKILSKIPSHKRIPLSEKEMEKILSLSTDWGVVTSEEDIDKYLYGKK